MYDVEVYIPHRFIKNLTGKNFEMLSGASYVRVLTLMGFDRFDSSGIKSWDDPAMDRVVFRFRTSNVIKPILFGTSLQYRSKEVR
jgi:hypothetical protein